MGLGWLNRHQKEILVHVEGWAKLESGHHRHRHHYHHHQQQQQLPWVSSAHCITSRYLTLSCVQFAQCVCRSLLRRLKVYKLLTFMYTTSRNKTITRTIKLIIGLVVWHHK